MKLRAKISKKKISIVMTALVLVAVAVLSVVGTVSQSETAYATRTIETRDEMGVSNNLHFYMSDTGVLSWDAVPGAAKYMFRSNWMPGDFEDWHQELTTNSYDIIGEYDNLKRDTHLYRFQVVALNDSGIAIDGTADYIIYYYISPYPELAMPTNLRWDGKIARWDAVEGATEGYKVTLYDTDANAVGGTQTTTNNYYDFSAQVATGYHFKVSTTKTSDHRGSNANDSGQYGDYSLAFDKMGVENKLHFYMSGGGYLTWDNVSGATGYKFETYYWPGDFRDLREDVTVSGYNLVGDFNNRKMDTGWYRIWVRPQGVSGYDDSIMYYYISPYSKMTTPTNLRWDDKTAKWDEVDGAWRGYSVSLYNLAGETVATYDVEDTECNFSEDHLKDGWIFSVSAKKTDVNRPSDAVTGPQFEPYLIHTGVYDATANTSNQGGQITVLTNHSDCAKGYGCYAEATNETDVTLTAYPDAGYRFVAWKIGNWNGQTLSTNSTYTFSANGNIRIMAVFRDASETHTVAFDTHGGNAVETQTVPYGMPATEPEPTYGGHVFMGWYTEAGYENLYDFETEVEADITLHAKWAIAIPSANILIDEPVAGEHPDFTLAVDGQHFTVVFDSWTLLEYDPVLDGYPELTPESVFEKGYYYELSYNLYADEGYAFPEDAVYTVNGEHAYIAGGDETVPYVRYDFEIPDEQVVEQWLTSANILIDEPVRGGHPDVTLVADGEHYRVELDDWVRDDGSDYTVIGAEDVFEGGKYYELSYRLYTDEPYGFTDDAVYTVNGRLAGRAGGSGATYIYVRYRFQIPEESHVLHVDDRTGEIATITELDDGIKVTATKACAVAITDDGGRNYTRIPAVAVDGEENTYKFSFTIYGNTDAVVAIKGDIEAGGVVNARDSAKLRYYLLSDENPNHHDLSALEMALADMNDSDTITVRDVSLLQYSMLSVDNPNHRDLEW